MDLSPEDLAALKKTHANVNDIEAYVKLLGANFPLDNKVTSEEIKAYMVEFMRRRESNTDKEHQNNLAIFEEELWN